MARFDAAETKEAARLAALRANELLPLVFLDVEIKVRIKKVPRKGWRLGCGCWTLTC